MKKAIMKKWVAALRSGKYRQAHGRLWNGKGYCCLGVLCEISKLGSFDHRGTYNINGLGGSGIYLPDQVVKWAGMKSDRGELPGNGEEGGWTSLSQLNDNSTSYITEALNFDEIADVIELTYKEL